MHPEAYERTRCMLTFVANRKTAAYRISSAYEVSVS